MEGLVTSILIAKSDYQRAVAAIPDIPLRNRFVEGNPVLNDSPASFIARPALKKFADVGSGPIRGMFDEPGVFDGDLFVVSGEDLYRVQAADGVAVFIGTIGGGNGDVSFAATAPIGTEPAHLFFAEGGILWLYMETAQAVGVLTASGVTANGNQVRIGDTYYQFTTGSVDTGTPAGTSGNPWLVFCTTVAATDLATLQKAINATGVAGTDYSTALTAHPLVTSTGISATTLTVTAIAQGPTGNSIVTTETGANLDWGGGTMSGGGITPLSQVAMPDDVGAISVAHINSYVIVVPVQFEDTDTVGKFFWIKPGEITVDPLDFATAERAPDKLLQVKVYGDLFWLAGQKTVEPWQTIGDILAPMRRYQGILYDRGSWAGTVVQVKDSLILVDEDGGVFQIAGGSQRISTPAVEELIFADFPSAQLGLYGTDEAKMRDGIWAETGEASPFSSTGLVVDPDPNIAGAGIVYRVSTSQNAQTNNRIVFPGGAVVTAGAAFRIYMASLPPNDTGTPYVNLRDNSNNFILAIRFRPDGSISAHSGAYTGTELGRSSPAVTASAWNHVEVKALRSSTVGTVEVRVNGAVVLDLDTLNLGAVDFAMFGLCVGGSSITPGTGAHYKDLVLWDGTGTENIDFQGSVAVRDLYPDADISLNWTPSTGSTGWDLIDETTPNDADYIQAGDPPPAAYIASLTNLPDDVTTVRALLPIVRAQKTDGGDCNIQIALTPNNVDFDNGADVAVTTAFKYTWDVSQLSPDTAAPWTPVEVNAAYVRANRTL
jgi:hypothetical protein